MVLVSDALESILGSGNITTLIGNFTRKSLEGNSQTMSRKFFFRILVEQKLRPGKNVGIENNTHTFPVQLNRWNSNLKDQLFTLLCVDKPSQQNS